jgi:hypothetical protein
MTKTPPNAIAVCKTVQEGRHGGGLLCLHLLNDFQDARNFKALGLSANHLRPVVWGIWLESYLAG